MRQMCGLITMKIATEKSTLKRIERIIPRGSSIAAATKMDMLKAVRREDMLKKISAPSAAATRNRNIFLEMDHQTIFSERPLQLLKLQLRCLWSVHGSLSVHSRVVRSMLPSVLFTPEISAHLRSQSARY